MKKLLLFLLVLALGSCSVQKRKYSSGYYVDWKSDNYKKEIAKKETKKSHKRAEVQEVPEIQVLPKNNEPLASAGEKLILQKPQRLHSIFDEPCDILIFKDGTELRVKLEEIRPLELKYRECEVIDGPLYTVEKSKVFMVKYANGTKEVFKTDPIEPNKPAPNQHQYNQGYKPLKTNSLAVASLVLGLLGIYPLSIITGIPAIICATLALNQIKSDPNKYTQNSKGLAMAGLISGIVAVAIFVIILLVVIATI